MTQDLLFDGQKATYNSESKILLTSIDDPFYAAGKKIPDWEWKAPGFGLNLRLIDFILKHKCNLMINNVAWGSTHRIEFNRLLSFLQQYNTDYKIRNTVLKIVPIEIFVNLSQKVAA